MYNCVKKLKKYIDYYVLISQILKGVGAPIVSDEASLISETNYQFKLLLVII